jgi:uncharacterized protein
VPSAEAAAAQVMVSQYGIAQYVLKVHSRCDLACDHCYVYEHADQSWRLKPRAISPSTAVAAARRIAEHAAAHRLRAVQVILHGGEPLLLGREAMREVLVALAAGIEPVAVLDLRIHTNGVRLEERWCELFGEFGVRVGVSLDGDQVANDRHRRFADGRSSHQQALRALGLLRRPEYQHLYAGILCTIDIANDPFSVYQALIAERPPRLDLLLPHATWDNPPPRSHESLHPYADWLLAIYRSWVRDGCGVPIRVFDSVLSASSGGPSWTEAIGLDPVGVLVIDTDGSWEQADSLKTAYDGAPSTGMSIWSHSADEAAQHSGMTARRGGLVTLSPACQACPVVRICGGGMYAHRYRSSTGFTNPSVYCTDLLEMITQVIANPPEVTVTSREPVARAEPRRPPHELPADTLDVLAAGPGDVAAVTAISQMRLSRTRALVAAAATAAGHLLTGHLLTGQREAALATSAAEGWAALCDLDSSHPGAIAEIFAHPYTRVWAMRCLDPPAGADLFLDRAHIAGLAAAVAMRAGTTVELPLPVRDGLVHVPSLGALDVGTDSSATVRVAISSGRVAAPGGIAWRAVRQVSVPGLRFAVEDLDPYRDCQRWAAAGRLDSGGWLAWHRALCGAARRLADGIPAYAQVLAAGMRAVVPLRDPPAGMNSATSRHAFGAVAITLAPSLAGIEDMLVHEFQHAKLFGLSDFYDLVDNACTQRLAVPWREDLRPVEGALHGTYAHLGLAQLSQSRGAAGQADWLRYRSWVADACEALRETKALTQHGERFVAGMLAAIQDATPPKSEAKCPK